MRTETTDPEVVITAGGTREKIDDVRYIGNFSGGRLGHQLARAYVQLGHRVLLLAPKSTIDRYGLPAGTLHESFGSAASLQERLLSVESTRLVLHAAAVSDYTPETVAGKLSSDEDELVLRFKRTPKILQGLRVHFGNHTTIVGFKLLSNVPEESLIDAAIGQMRTNQTDLCIANDLQELGRERRLHIVSPGGSYTTLQGDTQKVADGIARHIPVESSNYV